MGEEDESAAWVDESVRRLAQERLKGSGSVTTIEELIAKYGTDSIDLAVQRLVVLAPPFKGDSELASLLGEMMADLCTALREYQGRTGR